MSEKAAQPTPRRLRRAREAGDVGASAFAAQALGFAVAVALAPTAARALASRSASALRAAIDRAAALPAQGSGEILFDASGFARDVAALSLRVALPAALAGVVAHLAQTRGAIVTHSQRRLRLAAGWGALGSGAHAAAVARSLVATAIVAWIAGRVLTGHAVDFGRLARSHAGSVAWTAAWIGRMGAELAWTVAIAGTGLAIADAVAARVAWLRRHRMTRAEARAEIREADGDPRVKAARDEARRGEAAAHASIAAVEGASVVVIDGAGAAAQLACAIRYAPEEAEAAGDAPVVVAAGREAAARRILGVAESAGVPLWEDALLARALVAIPPGDAVPEPLYAGVAEALAAAPRTRTRKPSS